MAAEVGRPEAPVPGVRRTRRRLNAKTAPYVLLAPALALLTAFMLIPIGYSVWLSFRTVKVADGSLLGRRTEQAAGLSNYTTVLTDRVFWEAMGRMVVYGVIVVVIMFGLALTFALLLDHPRTRAAGLWRTSIFIPYAVPGVIASLMWGFIYLPAVSPIVSAFEALGLAPPDFLGSGTVLFSTANIAIWGGTGFNMIILYTALRAIPSEIYEAARIDGCSDLRIAFSIKIPMIAPAMVMTMIFALIAMIQVYNEPTALSTLSHAITSTWMPMMKIYSDAFVLNNTFLAAAESVLLALLTLGVSLGVMRATRRFQGVED
ncbi:sugar ABC transporter permease [Actinotalea sp. M2MS4P-6]|uniref:carbohydrate ABC transporter permease n=1 Tax=Actinotalea sp. M2MS4P-6 TaxID=2983762 RepID=UPI0021E430C7|nr:sugar ABC transporter permease [Actinotalea sp. M2MS4P-6]MCV2395312.1 sugar ABC transporter permease [Actinotalea sp. M2MS4P-6]